MNHARGLSALVLALFLLMLSPGAATAKMTETDGSDSGSGWSTSETERDAALLRHWGLDPDESAATSGGAGDIDVGAARNDIGPAAPTAPAAPETTPVTTGIEADQVIGWSAAGVALLAALTALALFLRRRHEHLVSHA